MRHSKEIVKTTPEDEKKNNMHKLERLILLNGHATTSADLERGIGGDEEGRWDWEVMRKGPTARIHSE